MRICLFRFESAYALSILSVVNTVTVPFFLFEFCRKSFLWRVITLFCSSSQEDPPAQCKPGFGLQEQFRQEHLYNQKASGTVEYKEALQSRLPGQDGSKAFNRVTHCELDERIAYDCVHEE